MLETPFERVKLLKAGISGKKIEELYIAYNNFKIVHSPVISEPVEIYDCEINNTIVRKQSLKFASNLSPIPSTG
jgi:hypothetical protein